MPIVSTDIKTFLSGGAANSSPNASLGGAISSTEVVDNTDNNIFDDVSGTESNSGDTEYRCVYVKNTHGSITLEGAVVWIQTNTPSADDAIEIGLGTSAVNGTEQTIADESTAPTGVTFGSAVDKASGFTIGNIPAGQFKAIWIKRIVQANANAYNANNFAIKVEGDTGA